MAFQSFESRQPQQQLLGHLVEVFWFLSFETGLGLLHLRLPWNSPCDWISEPFAPTPHVLGLQVMLHHVQLYLVLKDQTWGPVRAKTSTTPAELHPQPGESSSTLTSLYFLISTMGLMVLQTVIVRED